MSASSVPTPKKRVRMTHAGRIDLRNGILFISPWIIGFLVFTLYPILSSLYYSFTKYNVIKAPKWIGLGNYKEMLTDEIFLKGLTNTLYMCVFGVTATILIALLVAILLNNKHIKGLSFYRAVFFLPTLVPVVILAVLWIWLFQPETGLINGMLSVFGIRGPGWFADPVWAKPTFILMNVWCAGNIVIIFLAGLQEVPETLYEAVDVDGGNMLHKTWYITLPMLKPVIVYNVVTCLIRVLQSFAEAHIITQGGPNNATMFYALYLYRSSFRYYRMGYASAMAWVMLLIALLFTVVLFRLTGWGRDTE